MLKETGDNFFGHDRPRDSSIRMGGKMAYKKSHSFTPEKNSKSLLHGREAWFGS